MTVVTVLLFVAPCAGGCAASILMFWFFDIVFRRLSHQDQLKNFAKVIGWFIGNNAIMMPLLISINFNEAIDALWGNAAVVLAYVLGFSVSTSIKAARREPSLIQELRSTLPPNQVDAIILLLAFGMDASETASELGLSKEETAETFRQALLALKRRGKKIQDANEQR